LELERERERKRDIEPFVNEFGTARDARIEREREREVVDRNPFEIDRREFMIVEFLKKPW
jgi:hypothetical protein